MAMGYALSLGKPGVYSVVPGPGFLNSTAALSTAYATNAQVLCLAGQIPSTYIGRKVGLLHEIPDQLGILKSLTKWAGQINRPEDAPALVTEAFSQMLSGRPRPVGLQIPMDILTKQGEVNLTNLKPEIRRPPVDSDAIEEAAKLLGKAKNPMIVVGSGAFHARGELVQLAEALQAPVIAGRNGGGALSSRHYLSLPHPGGYQLWEEADVVIGVGAHMYYPLFTWGCDENLKIVRIDIDPEAHDAIVPSDVRLVADSKEALQALLPRLERYNSVRPSRREEIQACRAETEKMLSQLEPQMSFVKVIREALPDDGIFVGEVTQIGYAAAMGMPVYQPRTFIATGYQGTLGYGFATALGVKIGNPDKPVLAVSGDGGFMYNVQELATAVKHQIGLVTLVFNDNAFGNVRRMQKNLYDERYIGSDLSNPDFVKLAESYGAQGLRAESPEELRSAIQRGFAEKGPTLIEIPVGEMPDPWKIRNMPPIRGSKRT